MDIYKEFVCLASSIKNTSRCIAGKEIKGDTVGKWIRPVCDAEYTELAEVERRYQNGTTPELLDVIGVHFKEHIAHPAQDENYAIDDTYYWEKKRQVWKDFSSMLDTPPSLWDNGYSSDSGENDRVPVANITEPGQSLYFVSPSNLKIIVSTEGVEFNNEIRKISAQFEYNDVTYLLLVTDPDIETDYLEKGDGTYQLAGEIYLTISFGDESNNYYYKLVAGIIEIKTKKR